MGLHPKNNEQTYFVDKIIESIANNPDKIIATEITSTHTAEVKRLKDAVAELICILSRESCYGSRTALPLASKRSFNLAPGSVDANVGFIARVLETTDEVMISARAPGEQIIGLVGDLKTK